MFRKSAIAIVLAGAALLASSAPAQAQMGTGMRHHHGGWNAVRFWTAVNRVVIANAVTSSLTGYGGGYTYPSARSLAPLVPRGTDPAAAEDRSLATTAAASMEGRARVWIQLPPDAEVTIQGERLNAIGPVRVFNSPRLSEGASEYYDLKAIWEEQGKKVTQTQRVNLTAGSRVQVIFGGKDAARVYTLKSVQ